MISSIAAHLEPRSIARSPLEVVPDGETARVLASPTGLDVERDDFKSTHPATEAVEAEAKQTGGLRPARDVQNG